MWHVLPAAVVLWCVAGCGRPGVLDGPPSIATATEQVQAALVLREDACGRGDEPLPPQELQPRMPERNTQACRDAAFDYERAQLDLLQAKRRAQP